MNGTLQNRERDLWTSHQSDQPRGPQRHGKLWTIRQWKRISYYMLYVRCAAFFDTLGREFLMLIPMGRPEDIQLALRRREERKTKNKKSNVANLVEAQWVRGKAFPRGSQGTPWKKAPNDCDHPSSAIQKGGNAAMYYERCEICGNRWQRIPLCGTGLEDDAKQSHSAHVNREATGRDRTPFLSTRTRKHGGAGHATAESLLGKLDVHNNFGTQPGRVRRSLGPGELRGCRRDHGSHWGGRDPVPLKVQGQLKYVDQEACLQLV